MVPPVNIPRLLFVLFSRLLFVLKGSEICSAGRQSLQAAEQAIILPPDTDTRSRAHFTHALLIHAINYINHTLNGECYLCA